MIDNVDNKMVVTSIKPLPLFKIGTVKNTI